MFLVSMLVGHATDIGNCGGFVTRIEAHQRFYPAEAYHQDFMAKNPAHGYIVAWDAPKVAALRRMFPGFYRAAFRAG